jgi:TldD protein
MDYDRMLLSALNEASGMGIGFLEARWGSYRRQILGARDQIVSVMVDETSQGMNVRVFHKGAWGFSAAVVREEKDVIRLVKTAKSIAEASAKISGAPLQLSHLPAHQSEWKSPFVIDPFSVDLKEKLELLLELNRMTAECDGISEANSHMRFHRMEKKYVNTLGSRIDQTIVWSDAGYSVSAVGNNRCETREYPSLSQAIGYEGIDSSDMLKAAPRVAREAVEQLTAKPWDMDTADLILLPNHTRLVIHETIGHATELDRILGWEADYAGTSFATPEKLNSYRYGSDLFNVTADRTQKHGLATCAYDDEGVPSGEWPIVKNGILCGYSTTRDTAPLIGDENSHGCSFADHWQSFPILRMANIGIDPGSKDAPMLSDLIADTQNGILVDGMGAFSIDHQRINFQFGSDYCRRIRNGHLDEPLWNVVYDGSNPSFWSSVDAVCHPDEWRPYGVFGCAKGQPVQIAALTHGSAPMRLRNISIRRNS